MANMLIFDLDGLLADTERLHKKAYQTVFGGHGITITDAIYHRHWIEAGLGVGAFVEEHGLSVDADVIRREKAALYDRLVDSEATAMPGADALLASLSGRKTMGIATSSTTAAAGRVLAALNFTRHFGCVIGSDRVTRAKPFPDVFLAAAAELGADPGNCVVFEDTAKGIRAAAAAGMKSIAVPTALTRNADFSAATLVVASLQDVTLDRIEALCRDHGRPAAT